MLKKSEALKFEKGQMSCFVIPCGTKFLRVLIFAIFADFSAIRKNEFQQNKITANLFSAKIYSTVEMIYKNTDLKEKMP